MNSYQTKWFAVRQICQLNAGKKTADLDRLLVKSFKEGKNLVNLLTPTSLLSCELFPAKLVSISKGLNKIKDLYISTRIDQYLQYIVKNSCANQRAQKIWIFDADISACLNKISHLFPMEVINTFSYRAFIEGWLKCKYVDKTTFHQTGTFQNNVITPLIANIMVHGTGVCL